MDYILTYDPKQLTMNYMRKLLHNQIFRLLLLLIFFSLPSIFPLFHNGFIVTDDGEWMIIRFSAFHQALRDGQFPVRVLGRLNHEYGYPVANFLYPGFMYLAEPIHILGFGFIDTIKILFGLSLIFSAVFTFFWLVKIYSSQAAFIGALVYLYTPYHLFDIYTRGSLGEILTLAIVPFILWQLERKSIIFSSLGVTLLIISHNTLALLFLPLIALYVFARKILHLHQIIGVFAAGIGMSAFFLIPAIAELSLTQFSKTKISDPFAYFADVKLIGYSSVLIVVLASYLLLISKKPENKYKNIVLLFLCLAWGSTFLSSSYSRSLWNILPSSIIQFPFRILSITLLSVSFLAAYLIAKTKGVYKIGLIIVIAGLLVVSFFHYGSTKPITDKDDNYYATNMATTTVQDEYMPIWVKEKPTQRPKKKVEIVKGGGIIEDVSCNNKKISFKANLEKDSTVRVNTIFWHGWKAISDGKQTDINYENKNGVMEIPLPKGNHSVEFVFQETPLRLFADLLSIFSFTALAFFILKKIPR